MARGYTKPKAYKNNKIHCACGGSYTDAVYAGSFANCDGKASHELTKMHQKFLANGNKMDEKVKARLDKAAANAQLEKDRALNEKRAGQVHCGCGSYYNKNMMAKEKHFETAKHEKWARRNG